MIKRNIRNIKSLAGKLRALDRDEQGADMIEYILIIAAIALPALGLILIFRGRILAWIEDLYDRIVGEAEKTMP